MKKIGNLLGDKLYREISYLSYISKIYSRGLFWAIEFILDPTQKIALSGRKKFSNCIIDVAAELGLNITRVEYYRDYKEDRTLQYRFHYYRAALHYHSV